MFNRSFRLLILFPLVFFSPIEVGATNGTVDCPDESLQAAVDAASPDDKITVSGVCTESIEIKVDGLVIKGRDATIVSPSPSMNAITDGAVRVRISNLTIQGGSAGVLGKSNASLTLKNVVILDGILGLSLDSGAHAKLEGDVRVQDAQALGINLAQGAKAEIFGVVNAAGASRGFGINAQNNAAVRIEPGAELYLTENFVGGQFIVGSTLFLEGRLIANNNLGIGFSINTGASAALFNADLEASGNGLDGLDTVSAANLDVDGVSTVTANANGRDGISIDNGTLNTFGFFVGDDPGPRVTANNNARNGVLVELNGTLDIGVNSTIEARDNGAAGVAIDNGSIAQLRSSNITGNNGVFSSSEEGEDEDDRREHRNIDVLVTFGSQVTFLIGQ